MSCRFSNAAFNIVTDICTTILPLPILNTLRIPKKQKYLLMVVFGLGGITCVISVLRLQSLYVISKSTDISWDNPMAALWSSMEVNVGIICSVSHLKNESAAVHANNYQCIPTLKGLLTRVFPSLAVGESYFGSRSGYMGPSIESRPDAVDFGRLGHEAPEDDAEKAAAMTQEVYELGNGSTHDLPMASRRQSTMLPPLPPPDRAVVAARASLSTPPQVTQQLSQWLGKEIGHTRTDTIETARTVSTMHTTGTTSSRDDPGKSDGASTISMC